MASGADPGPGGAHEPQTAVDRAAEAGLGAVEAALDDEERRVFIIVVSDKHTPNATTAGTGFEDSADLFNFLLNTASGMADSMGIDMNVITQPRPGQG